MTHPEEVAERFQAAWNAHDMAALGALFAEDATFVNRYAHFVRGVDEIVKMHAQIHQTIYRDSTLDNQMHDLKLLGQEAAIVHFWCRLQIGSAHPAGPHTLDTLLLTVLSRSPAGWRIQAMENVTLVDPRTGQPVLRSQRNA